MFCKSLVFNASRSTKGMTEWKTGFEDIVMPVEPFMEHIHL
jgi:hypothetical protein